MCVGVCVYTIRVLWVGSHETIDAGPYTRRKDLLG